MPLSPGEMLSTVLPDVLVRWKDSIATGQPFELIKIRSMRLDAAR